VLLDKFGFQGATSTQIMFFVSIDNVILSLIASILTGMLAVEVTPIGWLALVGTSMLISVCGSLFFSIGVRETDAQVSAIASTLEPITSILAGVLFLQESITLLTAVGAVLILTAVILLSVLDAK